LNFKPKLLRDDLWLYDPADWPDCDLFHAGFPCQDFSIMGTNVGTHNTAGRGIIYKQILKHIEAKKPPTVLLENVKGMATRHRAALNDLCTGLRSFGYATRWKVIDAADCGLPQHRERLFSVAILQTRLCGSSFKWPAKLDRVHLESILDKKETGVSSAVMNDRKPPACRTVCRRNLVAAYDHMKEAGLEPSTTPMVVDVHANRPKLHYDCCPTLTVTRASTGGFWLSCRGRYTTMAELERLMGVSGMCRPATVSERQWAMLLGNGIPVPMLVLILQQLLPFAQRSRR
jgi:DNA-cytosine methyltransferase